MESQTTAYVGGVLAGTSYEKPPTATIHDARTVHPIRAGAIRGYATPPANVADSYYSGTCENGAAGQSSNTHRTKHHAAR